MPTFVQSHSTLLTVDQDISFDPETVAGLPSERTAVDLAVIGFADFVSGTYTQKSSNTNDIESEVTTDVSDLQNAAFKLLTERPTDTADDWELTTIGGTIASADSSKALLINDKSSVLPKSGGDAVGLGTGDWFANLSLWAGTNNNVLNGDNIKHGASGMGAVLVQAAGAALFGRLGKNAAIDNDTTIEGKQVQLAKDISGTINEASATNYANSKLFKRYLDSGRYEEDDADANATVNYNLDKANFDYMVQLKGSLGSSEAGESIAEADITRILGAIGDTNHKVKADLTYKMNIFMRIQQVDALA